MKGEKIVITWGTVIDIILNTFDKSQADFTKAIHGNKSSTSRIISGKISLSLDVNELYNSVLNPETPTSFAHSADQGQY